VGRPTPAERARTLSYGIAGGVLVTPDWPYDPVAAHVTDSAGRPLLLMPAGSPAVRALAEAVDLPATLRISDLAPVALADRVRGQAWLHGRLTAVPAEEVRAAALRLARLHPWPELLDLTAPGARPEWTLLTLEAREVEVQDVWGTATVRPAEYAAATPDPFVAVEADMLTHLDACHGTELATMFQERIAPHVDAPVLRPLGLDRYGLSLRCFPVPCEAHGTPKSMPPHVDLRVEFSEPVDDVHGLRRVYRELFGQRAPR
jgi:uncharacterized protein DUF2470